MTLVEAAAVARAWHDDRRKAENARKQAFDAAVHTRPTVKIRRASAEWQVVQALKGWA